MIPPFYRRLLLLAIHGATVGITGAHIVELTRNIS